MRDGRAYLLEVARCIADQLRSEGDEDTIGLELAQAFEGRVIGFEILTAPFAIAQLQLYILLDQLGARPPEGQRLSIFLTNALSGWRDQGNVNLNFPEMRDEFDASQHVKHNARIIVVIGNPPYDRFTGAAQSEEAELVAHYKGIELVPELDRKGQRRLDEFGRQKLKQRGDSLLYREYNVRKQLLDDLYIRFFRMAEERIGMSADYGILSFISNSSFLTGRSHPLMRHSLLGSFDRVWIDNLNGDKYRTGKIIPSGIPGAGTRDGSVFTTEADPRGIQPGTTITTWLKRVGQGSNAIATNVLYRDFWGPARRKREQLLSGVSAITAHAAPTVAAPAYEPLQPSRESRWRLAPRTIEAGYEAWPALDELFPEKFQGVNHNRGLAGGIIDADPTRLGARVRHYFGAADFAEAQQRSPEISTPRARYKPETAWRELKAAGHYRSTAVKPFLTFPFDQRHIYYSPDHKWLNEARSDYHDNVTNNEFLVTVPEPRKETETRPVFTTTLANLHVHERGSVAFPREIEGTGLFRGRVANLAEPTWRALAGAFGLSGLRSDAVARETVGRLFHVGFAALYAPSYQSEHKSALSADWAHMPIPRSADLFNRMTAAGAKVTRLLDVNADVGPLLDELLGAEAVRALGPLRRRDGGQIRQADLMLAISYWASAPGKWVPRPPTLVEAPPATLPDAWGESTEDLYINHDTFFANVPEAVWTFQLGGYPVLKKWLGYRHRDRNDEQPLTDAERRWFRSIVQRIAALLVLMPELDTLYQECASDAFTATELGISR